MSESINGAKSMKRCVEPELLDQMAASDPRAGRARQDLRRVNRLMQNAGILGDALDRAGVPRGARIVAEIGAGDGSMMLRLARRWAGDRQPRLVLVDRALMVSQQTRSDFAAAGWRLHTVEADVFDWLAQPDSSRCDVMVANLFLHHFEREPLVALLALI